MKNVRSNIPLAGCALFACVLCGCDVSTLYQDKYFNCTGTVRMSSFSHLQYEQAMTMHLHFLFGKGSVVVEAGQSIVFTDRYSVCDNTDQVISFNTAPEAKGKDGRCLPFPQETGASSGYLNVVSGEMKLTYGIEPKLSYADLKCKSASKI